MSANSRPSDFSSRAGVKLDFALDQFGISVAGRTCADLGCSTGGFTSCLLQREAKKVYAVDTGYGVLDWKLRQNPAVVVMERTNALHVVLEEPVDFVSVDVSWTPQRLILPHALSLLKDSGADCVSLLKPHYEAPRSWLRKGILLPERITEVVDQVLSQLRELSIVPEAIVSSPITGEKGGNTEFLMWVSR